MSPIPVVVGPGSWKSHDRMLETMLRVACLQWGVTRTLDPDEAARLK